MRKHFSAFYMTEKFYSETFTFRSAFNKPGNISDNIAVKITEVRVKSCKFIISNFCLRIGDCIEKRRFARIRESYQTDISKKFQFNFKICFLALCAFTRFTWCYIDRAFKMLVAEAAIATAKNHEFLPLFFQHPFF